jgi:hypothetical protein
VSDSKTIVPSTALQKEVSTSVVRSKFGDGVTRMVSKTATFDGALLSRISHAG